MVTEHLRPKERAVLRLADLGMPPAQIAWRFRHSPGHIDRILELAKLPRSPRSDEGESEVLRPIERCVQRARAEGSTTAEIAARLRRSPQYVERVDRFIELKQEWARR